MPHAQNRLSPQTTIAVIGGGPAGLMAAQVLAEAGATVTIYERMASPARKFLLAGRGGLNLTHSEAPAAFLSRYGAADPLLRGAIEAFPPDALRAWSESLGQPTFVGSSGRVFPQAFKASPLLRAWLRRLGARGVTLVPRHRWTGWDTDGRLRFVVGDEERHVAADATVLALGGASWPRLGSDASWVSILEADGIAVAPLRAANCGVAIAWSDVFRRFEGEPLKRIAITFAGRRVRGEAIVTRDGLEGGAVYAQSSATRDAIDADGTATITIDLLPDVDAAALTQRLARPRGKQSFGNALRKATHLAPVALSLLQEAARTDGGGALAARDAAALAVLIKAVPVQITGVQPIAAAISSAGGIRFAEIDAGFMLRRHAGVFVCGEMLDWDAPTGGYLLQASFATAVAAANGAVAWLHRPSR